MVDFLLGHGQSQESLNAVRLSAIVYVHQRSARLSVSTIFLVSVSVSVLKIHIFLVSVSNIREYESGSRLLRLYLLSLSLGLEP